MIYNELGEYVSGMTMQCGYCGEDFTEEHEGNSVIENGKEIFFCSALCAINFQQKQEEE